MWYVEEACIFALLSAYIHLDVQQTNAYHVSVMVPIFRENMNATVVCKVNNTELDGVNCPLSVPPVTRLRIILSNDPPSTPLLTGTDMCVFSSFLTCTHGPPVSALECGCYHDGGDIYTVNVTVRADRTAHETKTIDCRPDCINNNLWYGLVNTVTGVPVVFENTTTTTSTTVTTTTTGGTTITNTPPPTPPPPPPFPGWKIALIVIGIIIFIAIIIAIVVIVKKCKKEKQRGNRFHCCYYDIRKKEKCHSGFYHEDESASHNIYKFHCCSYDIRKKWTCPCGFYPDDESASHYIYKLYCCPHEKHKKGSCPCGFYPGDESSSSNEETPTPPPDGNNCNRTKVPPTPPPDGNNYNRTEVPTINTKAEIGNNWTELTTTTAPGGNNRTELNAHL